MRRVFIFAGIAALAGVVAIWADVSRLPSFDLAPFENTYALQQDTGLDFGHSPGERFPGFGGRGEASMIRLHLYGVDFLCQPARYDISAIAGVARGGKLTCGLPESSDAATQQIDDLMALFEASPHWRMARDLRLDPRRPEEWGRTTRAAIDFASAGGGGHPVDEVPLVRLVHDDSGSGFGIGVGNDRRAKTGPVLRVFVDFVFESPCLSELTAFQVSEVKPKDVLPEEYAGIASWFDGKSFSELVLDQWYSGASEYLREQCH